MRTMSVLALLAVLFASSAMAAEPASHPDDRYWDDSFPEYSPRAGCSAVVDWGGRLVVGGGQVCEESRIAPFDNSPYVAFWNGDDWESLPGFSDGVADPDLSGSQSASR